ncbi:latent-transforming growth factor beta-binding protein 4 isoform X2 [Channa argus]|uniref:latent-transforming growth factor beta-binding protein 4 isoform X2 n=1 Tax=Channa argus TaxID=215402 RepID=UPI003521EB89
MRLFLLCAWFLTLRTDAQQHPGREEGAVDRGWRRQSSGGPASPRLDADKLQAVRGSGEKPRGGRAAGRRGAAVSGPRVCGGQCCDGWTLSPKTRRCTKPRCFPRCQHQALCRRSNRCVCRPGFHGFRCEFSSATFSPLTSIHSTTNSTRLPVLSTAEPPVNLQRIHRPARIRSTAVRSDTPAFFPSPASSKTTTKDEAADFNPSSAPAPKSSELKTEEKGVYKKVSMPEEKGGPHKTEENMKAEESPARAEPESGINSVQSWAEKPEYGAELIETQSFIEKTLSSESGERLVSPKMPNVDPNPESRTEEGVSLDSQTKIPTLESIPWAETERNVSLDSKQKSKTGERSIERLTSNPMPKGEGGQHVDMGSGPQVDEDKHPESKSRCDSNERCLEWNCGTEAEDGVNISTNLRSKPEDNVGNCESSQIQLESRSQEEGKGLGTPDVKSNLDLRREEHLEGGEMRRNEEKRAMSEDARKEVKTRGKKQLLSLREAQAVLLRRSLSRRGRGDKLAALLMGHIEKERKKLGTLAASSTSSLTSVTASVNTLPTQRSQYVHITAPAVLCPLLCKNGGICLQKDRCLCPPNFTGKFCQIPVAPTASSAAAAAVAMAIGAVAPHSSTNEIVKPALLSAMAANRELTQSEFLLPLRQNQEAAASGAAGPSMVKVRVQHPPEASVKIHQVLKVSGFSPTLRTLSSSSSSGSAGAPAPAAEGVQAQTVRGGGTYTQQSGFKYCFREVKDGQCSSPLPGLRSREMCCRGIGKGWGITDCVLCPHHTGQSNSSCPAGFEQANGTQCVDMNECLQPGLCENGICVNTRGSYSCVCREGFILDATHGICISQSVISEEKSQCYRVLGSSQGPSSCSLPILRNITKQICCCSRVGKAWGPNCQRCPYFGSVAFKEICPAGPGYHYSASAVHFNQRVNEQLGGRGALLVPHSTQDNQNRQGVGSSSGSASTSSSHTIPSPPQPPQAGGFPSPRPVQPGSAGTTTIKDKPQTPSTGSQGIRPSFVSRPNQSPARGDSLPAPAQPQSPERGSRPSGEVPPRQNRPAVSPTTRPTSVQTVHGVCETKPGVCGRGRCVDQPGGKHTCECDQGYQPTSQRTYCQDVNECLQAPGPCLVGDCVNTMGSYRCMCPSGYRSSSNQQTSCQDIDECQFNLCSNGRCENTPGSYRCVCRLGYRLTGNICTDVDECKDLLQCPGQQCINSQGSYHCVSCQPGYGLLNGLCTDIDECRQVPCSNGRCENTPGSFRCVCRNGFKLHNSTCTDVDECAEPSQCPGQMCVNSVGSYRCVSCPRGYTLTNRQCTDVDECVQASQCPDQQCVNTVGSYRCLPCSPGYTSKEGSCQDIDECANVGACEAERLCVNTIGSFRCDCLPGYRAYGLSRQCRDINECLEGDFCFSRGECVNTPGSYTCVCSQGFTLSDNKTACLDVDECVKLGVCLDGRCENTDGSFLCQCRTGFTTNPERTACLDVDECVSSGGSVCVSQRCENTIGSYRCLTSCEPGFKATGSGECVDINECANKTVCGDHAICQNTLGTYLCTCNQGFISAADGKTCVAGTTTDSSSSSSSSTSFHASVVELDPMLPPVPAARPGELRECYYNLADGENRNLLAVNTSQQECCCTVGEGWGLGSQYHNCPPADTVEFLSLCPSGRGYVTTGPGAFSYRDVDECKRFHPEVCKNGVCVNNIPGYSCYCSSGYVYNSMLLECVDHDECEEESCVGGVCVNTVGSYYCSCPPPLVLDNTQRNCVNSSDLTVDENLSVCWQHLSADMMCQSPLLGAQVTYVDCCCLYGVGWGMECAICPPSSYEDYYYLCSSVRAPVFPDSSRSETGTGRGGVSGVVPSTDFTLPDYDDYHPAGGGRSSFRGRTPATYSVPDPSYRRPEYSTGYYSEGDYSPPDGSPPRPPSLHLPLDPRTERAFGARPPPPSQPDGPALSLAPLPGAFFQEEEEDEDTWRPGPPFPPFSERGGGGGGRGATPRRVYERPYDSYTGVSAAEDCGILHGCENGRCIRVAEGYTCDCYQGYELDMTSMTCIDMNECEDSVSLEYPCVNARCVNTEGSFRCVCRRGYVMSRRPNHCVAA